MSGAQEAKQKLAILCKANFKRTFQKLFHTVFTKVHRVKEKELLGFRLQHENKGPQFAFWLSEGGDVVALLWWEGVHATVACVPSVHDALLKGRS